MHVNNSRYSTIFYRTLGFLFFALLLGIGILQTALPDREISYAERRRLAGLPALSSQSFFSGSYMDSLETYLLDQFPLRDSLRSLKANFDLGVLRKKDTDGYYLVNGSLYELPAPLKENNIRKASQTFSDIIRTCFPDSEAYYAIIPDKNYYAALSSDSDNSLANDIVARQQRILSLYQENCSSSFTEIDFSGQLSETDFYATDIHWKQECLPDIVDCLLTAMQTDTPDTTSYRSVLLSDNFYGGLSAASGLKPQADSLICLTGDSPEQTLVYDYDEGKNVSVYQKEKLFSPDPYDIYLGGAKALLKLTRLDGQTGRELVLFRDSFGSSLAPLLLSGYDVIYLIDLRYITASAAMRYISPAEDCDVLFLYSAATLNGGGIKLHENPFSSAQ